MSMEYKAIGHHDLFESCWSRSEAKVLEAQNVANEKAIAAKEKSITKQDNIIEKLNKATKPNHANIKKAE